MKTYRIVYFPLEQKYSVWDNEHNLVKEWFDTIEQARTWLIEYVNKLVI